MPTIVSEAELRFSIADLTILSAQPRRFGSERDQWHSNAPGMGLLEISSKEKGAKSLVALSLQR